MKIQFTLFVFLLFCTNFLIGQSATSKAIFGANWNIQQPLGAYADNVYQVPMGLSFDALFPIKKLKGFYVGGSIGVGMLYKESYELAKRNDSGTFKVDEEDCYLTYHLTARYFLRNRSILTPYAEGKIGGISYFSSIYSDEEDEVDFFENETEFHGTALNLGLGGGLLFRLSSCLSLDTSVSFNQGTKTNFRSVDSKAQQIKQDLDESMRESKTDFVNYRIGILFGF